MFVLREVDERKANPYYYNSMIGGCITHVDESLSEAMKFGTREEAEAELAQNRIYLKEFEVQEVL